MGSLPPGVLILIIALLSACAGALLTWSISYALGGGGEKTTRESSNHAPHSSETDELLRVSRTKKGLTISVQGKPVRHLREIRDPEVGRETVGAIKAVLTFSEGWLPALREQQASSGLTSGLTKAGGASSLEELSGAASTASRRSSGPSVSEPLRLVEEIDALVQERLQARPDLVKRGIRLTHDVDGHLIIYVGQQGYRSADEIPDDDVRAFIRDTIRTWENK